MPLLVATLVIFIDIFALLNPLIEIMGYEVTSLAGRGLSFILMLGSGFVTLALFMWIKYHMIVKSGESILPLVRDTVEARGSCKIRFGGRSPFKFPSLVGPDAIDQLFKVLKQEEQHFSA